jgi:hypothetical protein
VRRAERVGRVVYAARAWLDATRAAEACGATGRASAPGAGDVAAFERALEALEAAERALRAATEAYVSWAG